MLCFLLLNAHARFYRVEVTETLFGDYTVSREWGRAGSRGASRQIWHSNLRDAVQAADRWRSKAMRRGYGFERITA
ncbi:WGR domain-containing protein [Xinfangfangia sp. CPCC 101601]|uniref:WGR domain-containing protein n=1 Tax=Pseudogemmobacter lacusdianii TaxID=3069608 RepID=A0ABU0VWU3_9RHOB|nr:WGR domain-containing protein [Xinfangfangia sp. CPCC 101601]MDQ2066246.1 WGR domain-containing protein [Xinfangfangia sp. CPCC 101601]